MQNRIGWARGLRVGRGMSAVKISEAGDLGRGFNGAGDNPFKAAARLRFERSHHGVRGFANGNHGNPAVGIQVVEIFGNTQNAAIAFDVSPEAGIDAGFVKRTIEEMTGGVTHLESELAIRHYSAAFNIRVSRVQV